jgi:hypothetical protein
MVRGPKPRKKPRHPKLSAIKLRTACMHVCVCVRVTVYACACVYDCVFAIVRVCECGYKRGRVRAELI